MLATKNRTADGFIFILALVLLLTGCGPPGPRALLDGKRLLDKGEFDEAAGKLKTAATLLSTNAQAWNYLGLAYHRAGQPTNAVAAYRKALDLDRNLSEARFNLGCLWLEQNNLDAARAEFTAYTLRRPNAAEGWVKLGFTQLRARDIAAAEKSFAEALRLNPQNPDVLNGLGLTQLQRNRPREAAQNFNAALRQQPGHRAALLNLARVSQVYLNDRPGALRLYRDYLALKPRPDDWDAVNVVAQALEQQLTPQQRPALTNVVAQVVPNVPMLKTQATAARPIAPPKTETARSTAQTTTPQAALPLEVVSLPPEPVIKTSPDASPPPVVEPSVPPVSASTTAATVASKPAKRGFFQKLNPVNLFRREPKVTPMPTPLPPAAASNVSPKTSSAGTSPATRTSSPSAKPTSFPRYHYVSPAKPAAGNRAEAEQSYEQGVKLRETGRASDAAQFFRQAVKSDPAYFEAQFNLALAEFESKQYKKSLTAWETALAIRPDSTDASYNFALALKAANYPLDAAKELEKILAANPDEARAHLALGNLCAEQLRDTAQARAHYLRVLDLSPNHPQAGAIRYWLVSHPQ
jgi:tetratricopeptide (TPR) repeat protein